MYFTKADLMFLVGLMTDNDIYDLDDNVITDNDRTIVLNVDDNNNNYVSCINYKK